MLELNVGVYLGKIKSKIDANLGEPERLCRTKRSCLQSNTASSKVH